LGISNFVTADGETIEFECENTIASRWTSREILNNSTYPTLPFIGSVETILDIGANCGAAAVHFARAYPDAAIHSFEPGSLQRSILERNAAGYPGIRVHPFGLHSEDQTLTLYPGLADSGQSSLIRSEFTSADGETVEIRSAAGWIEEAGVQQVDIVKVDVEGVETEVLRSLSSVLQQVKVVYVEYESRADRRTIDKILEPTHALYSGKVFLDQGELVYLANDLADQPEATDHLKAMLAAALGG